MVTVDKGSVIAASVSAAAGFALACAGCWTTGKLRDRKARKQREKAEATTAT